jgi:NAD(P) transhydrogenase subunit alpha
MHNLILMLGVFVFSFVIGYLLISNVPQMLHTPLMCMTNAISAVTIVGVMLVFASETSTPEKVLGAIALVMVTFNLAGGFVITDRMLGFFKKRHASATRKQVSS